jgi:hypothetical protein
MDQNGREARCVGTFADECAGLDEFGLHRHPLCFHFFRPQGAYFAGWTPAIFAGWVGMRPVGDSGQRKRRTSHDVRRSMITQSKAASVHVASLQSVYLSRRGNLGTSRAARNGQSLPGVCGGGFSAGLGLRVDFQTANHAARVARFTERGRARRFDSRLSWGFPLRWSTSRWRSARDSKPARIAMRRARLREARSAFS